MSTISKSAFLRKQLRTVLVAAATIFYAAGATAGIHTWDVVEVFSNANGTIQYVELFDFGTNGTEVNVGNGSLSSGLHSFSWANGTVTGPTNGQSYLIATAAFAALPGAPLPDVIIPADKVPFFSKSGDTVTFGNGDALTFGPVPINGSDSFDEGPPPGVGPNTPKNYAGVQGNVFAPALVPSWSDRMLIPTVSLIIIGGLAGLRRRRVAFG
ncbi:MAG: hypothetical protein JRE71_15680 [Deltaproteobacteria bacterium]|nr:hypothetical protein [Deltaproteobacteria bacterium]